MPPSPNPQGFKAKAVEPRMVFLSFVAGEPFSERVFKRLSGKINKYQDKAGRLIRVLPRGPGKAGNEVGLWEITPTDVVVLFSDEYSTNCVEVDETHEDTAEFNLLLKKERSDGYHLWFGVVQNSAWREVQVEGRPLKEFEQLLHDLLDQFQEFDNDLKDETKLDNQSRLAGDRMREHLEDRCPRCRANSSPPPTSGSPAAPRGGLLSRFFGRR
jgi:hypothetical protein